MPSERFTLVDGLRAIAALSVVAFHSLEGDHVPLIYATISYSLQSIVANGNCGVAIFFVLSGFVIAHSIMAEPLGVGDVGQFMLRRSLRLDPPYWFAIALTCSVTIFKGDAHFTIPQIGAHLIYAQDLLGLKPISPIFWTLCLEVQFYLVFALLLLSRSPTVMVLAFVSSIPFSVVVTWPGLFTSLWYGFLLGVAAYASWKDQRLARYFLSYAACFIVIAIVKSDVFMAICALTALLLFYAATRGRLTTYLNWRWVQFLGTISYSLYLIHNPVTGVTFRIGARLLGHSAESEMICLIAAILLSIAAATLMWLAIERPSIWLSRQIKPLLERSLRRDGDRERIRPTRHAAVADHFDL